MPNWNVIKDNMNVPIIIDGRNIFDAVEMQNMGIKYSSIGK
jgi:UDPglucose 6-dehydrogenase